MWLERKADNLVHVHDVVAIDVEVGAVVDFNFYVHVRVLIRNVVFPS